MKKLLSLILAILLTLTLFTSCAETSEALASMYLNMGEKYLLDLNYEEAIVYFNKVIEVEPRNSRAYMGAAEAYVGLGDTESAIELLKTALEVFSDDEEVTIELLEMLIEIDPTTSEWYITLADIYEGMGDMGSAVAVLSNAVDSITDSDSKITILQRLIGLDVANVDWYLELAQAYADSSDRTSAISTLKQGMDKVGDDKTKLYGKLIEIDSGTTQWYFELAGVYEDKNNISSAVDTLELGLNNFEDDATKIDFSEELIEIDETNAEWYLTIAYIYIDQTNTNEAIAILREGLEKASDTTEIEALLNQLAPDTSELVEMSTYYYDEDGNVDESFESDYNSNGWLIQCSYSGISSSIWYIYDLGNGQSFENGVVKVYNLYEDDSNGKTIYEYDSNGNLSKVTCYNSLGAVIYTARYNSYGNITYMSDSNSYDKTVIEYEYDDNNVLISTSQTTSDDYSTSKYVSDFEREVKYDSNGNIVLDRTIGNSTTTTSYTFSDDTYTYSSVSTEEYVYEYDSDNRLVKKTYSNKSESDDWSNWYGWIYEYEYDANGYVSKHTFTSNYTYTYSYTDEIDESISTTTYEYTHDTAGNTISWTVTSNGASTTYITEREYEYGSDGKVSKCVITTYYADSGSVYSVQTMERIN